MPRFSDTSHAKLLTCHKDLQDICNEAIKIYDFAVICGHRTKEEQQKAFDAGFSKVRWPDSKHNKTPSLAVDLVPYPIDWNDRERFQQLAGIIKGIAHSKLIKIEWGGDWKMQDLPHFQLMR